jgi:hypothetical protein
LNKKNKEDFFNLDFEASKEAALVLFINLTKLFSFLKKKIIHLENRIFVDDFLDLNPTKKTQDTIQLSCESTSKLKLTFFLFKESF